MALTYPLNSLRLPSGAPPEGNKVITVVQTLKPGEITSIYPISEVNRVTRVASILVDASKTYTGFEIVFQDTQRRIVVPSGSESCHRTFSNDGSFTVQNLDTQYNAVFRAWLFSCPQPVYERFPGAALLGDVLTQAKAGEFAINPGGKVATYNYAAPVLPTGSVWDTALATPVVVLSDNNLKVTISGDDTGGGSMRTPSYRGSGRYYFEADVPGFGWEASGRLGFGFANTFQGDGRTTQQYADVLLNQQGQVYLSGSKIEQWPVNGGTNWYVGIAVDIDAARWWVTYDGNNWSPSGNPFLATGGGDLSALPKPWAPTLRNSLTNYQSRMTLHSGQANIGGGLVFPVPAGFQAGWPAV